jgi:TonB family protein
MRFILGSLLFLFAFAGFDQPPRQPLTVHVESLAYPDVARAAQIQGEVDVEIEIDSQGNVSSAAAVSGHPVLKQAAEKNIRAWKFDASSSDGRRLTVGYRFILGLPKTYYRPETHNLFDLPTRVTVISKLPERQP